MEETFYLAFPLVARLLPSPRRLVPLLIALLIAGPLTRAHAYTHNQVWYEYSYLGGMDAIAFGCLTAMFLARRQLGPSLRLLFGCAGTFLLAFSLGDSLQSSDWHLERLGLSMSLVALGAALLVAAAAASQWKAPRVLTPLRILGERSYEIYLTHMFVVLACFAVFQRAGKPLLAVPLLFLAIVLLAGALGWLVAVIFAEPANRYLRRHFRLGISARGAAEPEVD